MQETPGVRHTGVDRFFEVLNGAILVLVGAALVVVEPAELLEDLGVRGRVIQDALIGSLGAIKL